jgi:hypothetical protein
MTKPHSLISLLAISISLSSWSIVTAFIITPHHQSLISEGYTTPSDPLSHLIQHPRSLLAKRQTICPTQCADQLDQLGIERVAVSLSIRKEHSCELRLERRKKLMAMP